MGWLNIGANAQNALTATSIINPAFLLSNIGTLTNIWDSYQQNKWNKKNYDSQQRQLAYQMGLQNEIFNREDTSIQRRVADLKAAGLSPVLAAGQGAASGGIISTTVPQGQPTTLTDKVLNTMAILKMESDISKTQSENEYIDLQKSKIPYDIAQSIVQSGKMLADTKLSNATTSRVWSEKKVTDLKAQQEEIRTGNVLDSGSTGDSIPGKIVNDIMGNIKKASGANLFNLPNEPVLTPALIEQLKLKEKAEQKPKRRN